MCRLCDSNQGHHQKIFYISKYFKILSVTYNNLMSKKIGLFWLRDDFRILKKCTDLAEATKNHEQVV